MGKQIVVFGFVITFIIAIVIFFTKANLSPKESPKDSESKIPRLILEDFTVYKYEGYRVKSTLYSRLGHIIEPNIVQLFADIRGMRHRPDGSEEQITCDTASALFSANNLNEMFNRSQLIKAEVEDNVNAEMTGHTLRTEYAQYLASEETLSSNQPVEILGPKREFHGDTGFIYTINENLLKMNGMVNGSFLNE